MDADLQQKMEEAWGYVWSGLFCPKTRLFYDYRTSRDPAIQFDHLPTPDEIALQCPNPAGWGTGMEDSMLSAGSVLEALCLRRKLTADPAAPARAAEVMDGVMRCAHVHGVNGFLVRSLCPDDGRSCYFNSSRDQFTLAVHGAWRVLDSFPDAPGAVAAGARRLLTDIAAYCERVITPGQDDLLRLDGKPALVSTMVYVAAHERLRLPMFHAAAWAASRDQHWFELYRRYAVSGIEDTLKIDRRRDWWDWELPQLQLSIALLRDVETDPGMKEKYARAMLITAELADRELRKRLKAAAAFTGDWDCLNSNWRHMPMVVRPETLDTPGRSLLYGGYPYLMPQFPDAFHAPSSLLRAVGNLAYTAWMCPEHVPSPGVLDGFRQTVMKPDYRQHGSGGPVNLLHAYWVGRSRGFF